MVIVGLWRGLGVAAFAAGLVVVAPAAGAQTDEGGVGAQAAVNQVVSVATGASHSCALLTDRTARCWGDNNTGQLGDNTITSRKQPRLVLNQTGNAPLTNIAALALGDFFTCARMTDATARCWGENDHGQLGDGTMMDRHLPVIVKNGAGTGPVTGVAQLTAGGDTACARFSSAVSCWGENNFGQVGDGSMMDRARPRLVKRPSGIGALGGVSDVAAGGLHTCARISGAVRCWGRNIDGELGNGTSGAPSALPVIVKNVAGTFQLTGTSQIVVGFRHSCAKVSSGAVCWGSHSKGQSGNGDNIFITPKHEFPVRVKNEAGTGLLSGIVALTAYGEHTCARVNLSLRCWGDDNFGKLGDNSGGVRNLPVVVLNEGGYGPLGLVTQASAGGDHTCARFANGTADCWGLNNFFQLGDGTQNPSGLPRPVVY
jgi:alpha-tubulin suppressor-like RCC1 family protein